MRTTLPALVLTTILTTFLTTVLTGGIAWAQLPPPTLTEDTTRVSEHVQAIMGFPNIAIVTGDKASLVVDTGLGPANGATIARVAQRLARGPVLYLTTTHFHPEHAAGEAGFPDGTILIRPTRQQQELERDEAQLMTVFRGISPEFGELLDGVTGTRPADITFDDEIRLDLGGVTVRLMWLGTAHTEGDELIFVEPDSVLISGDIVQNKVVPAVPAGGGSLSNWISILERLEQLAPQTILPTHSRVGPGSLIAEDRAFFVVMRNRALALKQQGISAADAAARLTEGFRTDYPEWAANTDWNNINAIPGLVNRIYREDE